MERSHNFFAGPAVMPVPALEAGIEAIRNFDGLGVSILEVSHRSKQFVAVVENAERDLRELMGIPDNYSVLFVGGGASTQFAHIPMNFMKDSADYINTGAWTTKAIKEAKLFGTVNEIASSKASGFDHIPAVGAFTSGASYVHIASNNTIYGTQWAQFPDTGDIPLICDMSSDILCREIDVSKFAMIYAGAQKNMGPAGVTVIIIRDDLLERVPSGIPTMLKYTTHAEKGSMFNTPPAFPIFMVGCVLKWLKSIGGIAEIERVNRRKAAKLYAVLDKHDIYLPHARKDSRSLMNVTWRMANDSLVPPLLERAAALNMLGLKGHRSVGGFRASIYNACPESSVDALCELLDDYAGTC